MNECTDAHVFSLLIVLQIVPPEGYEFLKVHPILGIVVTCLTVINVSLFKQTNVSY